MHSAQQFVYCRHAPRPDRVLGVPAAGGGRHEPLPHPLHGARLSGTGSEVEPQWRGCVAAAAPRVSGSGRQVSRCPDISPPSFLPGSTLADLMHLQFMLYRIARCMTKNIIREKSELNQQTSLNNVL